jgi:hypothetical protein
LASPCLRTKNRKPAKHKKNRAKTLYIKEYFTTIKTSSLFMPRTASKIIEIFF